MKFLRIVSILLILIIGVACTETAPSPDIEFPVYQSENITFDPKGGMEILNFTSALDWYIEMHGGDGWLSADQTEGAAGSFRVALRAEANETDASRSAEVFVCSGDLQMPISVTQEMYMPVFELEKDFYEVSAAGRELVINVFTDMQYTCKSSVPWINPVESKASLTYQSRFTVDPNPDEKERTAEIIFTAEDKVLTCRVLQRPAGTEADDWKHEDFVGRSLAMRFTADWCGYCPYMASAFSTAKSDMCGALEVISVHGDGGLVFSSARSLISRFGVEGFPTGIVDNRAMIPNYSNPAYTAQVTVAVVKEKQSALPPVTGIAVSSSLIASDITVDLTVYAKEADTYRVTAILVEDNIVAYQYGVNNPYSYVHNDVARHAVTPVSGEEVEIGEGGGIWTGTFKTKIPAGCKKENMRILVYVERSYGDMDIACGVEDVYYKDYGGRFVDNCRSVPVGTINEVELR